MSPALASAWQTIVMTNHPRATNDDQPDSCSFASLYTGNPDNNTPTDPVMAQLAAKLRGKVRGELDFTTLARGIYSTDAGNYRVVPQAVFAPIDKDDALTALAACRELGIPITARGAGTSCAGNAIGPGLVVDFQRHMNRVLTAIAVGWRLDFVRGPLAFRWS